MIIPSEESHERNVSKFFFSQFAGIVIGCLVTGGLFTVTRSLVVSFLPYAVIAFPLLLNVMIKAIRKRNESKNESERSYRKIDTTGLVIGFCLWTLPVILLIFLLLKLPIA